MAKSSGKIGVWPLLICWGLTAAAYVGKAVLTSAATPLILDTDDAMRLNEVHDFLNGQGWYDLVQHRLNTPFGAELHWSRLVDLPEATLLLLFRPLLGGLADTALLYVWPLLLLLPMLWLTGKLAMRLGGVAALWPALLLPAFSLVTLSEFAPGRVDHHSMQILLTLLAAYCTLRSLERPVFAIGAGLACALAIAIGIESLPMIATLVAVFALGWVVTPAHAVAMRDFGLSFALVTALALAIGVHPARWLEIRLDAISIVYTVAATLGGAAFLALSLLPLRSWPLRLVAILTAGGAVGLVLLQLDPDIIKGPYAALDPWLVTNWLAHISEAQSWAQSIVDDPLYPIAVTLPVVLALAISIWNAVRTKVDRGLWFINALLFVSGLAVMLIQIRGARLVTPLAVPACATLVAALWRRNVRRPGLVRAFGVVLSAMASAGLVIAIAVALVPLDHPLASQSAGDRQSCLQPSAFADLGGLAPQAVMAPIDLGSHLLLFTSHSVVGAPYHRNQQGLADTLRFFDGPIDAARRIVATRHIALVVICPAMSEMQRPEDRDPGSLAALYASGNLPKWLVEKTPSVGPLKIYTVNLQE